MVQGAFGVINSRHTAHMTQVAAGAKGRAVEECNRAPAGKNLCNTPNVARKRRFVMRLSLALTMTLCLAACAGKPSPEQRASAQDELNQSGHPYDGPRGILSSASPADSSFTPLRCHLEGPGEVCNRDGN